MQVANTLAKEVLTAPGNEVAIVNTAQVGLQQSSSAYSLARQRQQGQHWWRQQQALQQQWRLRSKDRSLRAGLSRRQL